MMKSTKLAVLFMSFAITAISPLFTSCGSDEEENSEQTDGHSKNESKIISQLIGTSWMTYRVKFYDYNNKEVSTYDNTKYPDIITFTSKRANSYNTDMVLYGDYNKYHPYNKDGYTYISSWNVSGNQLDGYPGAGNAFGEILSISKSEIRTKYIGNWEKEWYRIDTYIPSQEPIHNFKPDDGGNGGSSGGNSGGGSTGGSTSYEKPDIAFSDFTAYQTKLKVVYKIYNKDKAKVTSAKVYYGTSSNPTKPVTATVSGVLITANISGLKKGTTYYVKCVATGKGGTTTTGTTKVITNY